MKTLAALPIEVPADRGRRVRLLAALGGPEAADAIEALVAVEPALIREVGPLGDEAVPLVRRALAATLATTHEPSTHERSTDAPDARTSALWAAARLASPELAPDVWPHLHSAAQLARSLDRDAAHDGARRLLLDAENHIGWALQALLAAGVVRTPFERAQALDAFVVTSECARGLRRASAPSRSPVARSFEDSSLDSCSRGRCAPPPQGAPREPTESAFGPHFTLLAPMLAASVAPWVEDALAQNDELLALRVIRAMGSLREWAREVLPTIDALVEGAGPALRAELTRAKDHVLHPPPMFRPNR